MLFNVLLRKLNMYEVLGRGANIAIKRFAFFFLLVFFFFLLVFSSNPREITLRRKKRRHEEKKYALEIIQTFRS